MQAQRKYDVIGIGSAIVDILAKVDDGFLNSHKLHKSTMTLIDRSQAETIYSAMPPAVECSGGSAANTIAGVASLQGKTAFIGKVNHDFLGEIFTHDMKALGVAYKTIPATGDGATARCLVSVTPDAQRTMATYLGDKVELTVYDIDEQLIAESKILYVEGYLWDGERAKQAIWKAMELARKHGTKIAFSLSDPFCVMRHRHEFLDLVEQYIDILFANEEEITALLHMNDFETAARQITNRCPLVALTRGARGSVIVTPEECFTIPASKDVHVVDTTGAGDLYASGLLYGIANDYKLDHAGKLANATASHIISHLGARPSVALHTLNPFQDAQKQLRSSAG